MGGRLGLYDRGNVAAVCRTAEALGVGAVHVVVPETEHYKKSRRSSAGAEKWVEVQRWDSTRECLTAIKQAGYKIYVRHHYPINPKIHPFYHCIPKLRLNLESHLNTKFEDNDQYTDPSLRAIISQK